MARRRQGGERPLDVDAVLGGAQPADAAGLISLIHRVNPTDRGLGKAAEERRYHQKAALQSLLIRRYGEHLEVVQGADEGTISLQHRLWERDAAHAVIAELDDDARSWVWGQLDGLELAAPELASPGPVPALLPDDDPLLAASAALAEYDFEGAELLLRGAFRERGGGLDASVALLELLVDHLAAWSECPALVAQLAPGVQDDPRVAGLLCEAAGRRGDREACQGWARRASDPRRSVGLAAAARSAVSAGDLLQAEALLAGVDSGPCAVLPEVRAAAGALARLADERRDLARGQLFARLEGSSEGEQLPLLDVFLRAHPADAAARARRRELGRRLAQPSLRRAEAALDAGQLTEARAALEHAAALTGGEGGEELKARLERAVAQQQAAALRAEIDACCERGALAEALERFELLPEAEQRSYAAGAAPCFGHLLALKETSRREAAVLCREAALALQRAEEALEAGDEARAELLVAPHRRLLDGQPVAAPTLARLHAALRRQRTGEALDGLDAAASALKDGAIDEAAGILRELRVRELPPEDRARAERLRASIEPARRRAQETSAALHALAGVQELLEGAPAPSRVPDLLAAAEVCELAAQGATEKSGWDRHAERCRAAAQRHSRIEELVPGFAPDQRDLTAGGPEQPGLVRQGERELAVWTCGDRLIWFDPAAQRAWRVVLPHAGRDWWPHTVARGDTLLQITDGRWIGTYDLAVPCVLSWARLQPEFPDASSLVIVRRGRLLWIAGPPDPAGHPGLVHLLDRDRGVVRDLDVRVRRFSGNEEADLVIAHPRVGAPTCWTVDGRPSTRFASELWSFGVKQVRLNVDPLRVGLLLAPKTEQKDRLRDAHGFDMGEARLALALLRDDGSTALLGAIEDLPGARQDVSFGLAGPERLLVLNVGFPDGRRELRAWSWEGFEPMWRQELPWGSSPQMGSLGGGGLFLRLRTREGLRSRRLERCAPPEVPACAPRPLGELPSLQVGLRAPCGHGQTIFDPANLEACRRLDADRIRAVVQVELRGMDGVVRAHLGRAALLLQAGHRAVADEVISGISARFPGEPDIRLFRAALAADDGRWEQAASLLREPVRGREQHRAHLLAVALLRAGRRDEALEVLGEVDIPGADRCGLGPLRRLIEPLPDSRDDLVHALRHAVLEADRALAEGNAHAALDAVNTAWLREAGELQSGARLVEAVLLAAGDDPLTASGELALAGWLGLLEATDVVALPYLEAEWPPDRLQQIARRARARRA